MPEGPEIRRAADRVARVIAGRVAREVWFARDDLAPFAGALTGDTVVRVDTWGKAMLTVFAGGWTIYSHNQLYGRWSTVASGPDPVTTRQLRLAIRTDRGSALLYSASDIDVWRSDAVPEHPFLRKLGPDVLDPGLTVEVVAERLADRRFRGRRLAALLLDQAFVAGVGNYLRAEALFWAELHPQWRPRELDDAQRTWLAWCLLHVARQSYATAGTTNDPEVARELRSLGWRRRAWRHAVFGRAGAACHRCGDTIERFDAGGRRIYVCPTCQPAPGPAGAHAPSSGRPQTPT